MLLSKYYWLEKKKNPFKRTNQKDHEKDLVKIVKSKTTSPRWHLGQVGQGPFGVIFYQSS